jgi:hypothetical protein
MYAAKGLLDHLDGIGFGGGYRFAILVGNCSNSSTGSFELVGGVSQRLVLIRIPAKGVEFIPRSEATRNPS